MSDSGEIEAVPHTLDEIEDSAALAKMPVEFRVADIYRRLREGNRRHAKFRSQIEELHNLVAPRATPRAALRVLGWALAAAVMVGGWVVALDRFARSSDLRDLDSRVRTVEGKVAEIGGKLAKP